MLEDWTIYSWYCPNCKTQVAGLKNKKNQIRVICTKCSAEMVRTVVGRRHDVIDIYAPIGMEHPLSCGDLPGFEVCDENRHGTAESCYEGG